jgi:surfeit locus 1 family protein
MRKVFTPHWIAGHLLALSLISIFIYAGFWQIDRLAWRKGENALLEGRHALEAVRLEDSLGLPDLEFRNVTVSGVYEPEHELLRRSRSHNSVAGWHVLTPLRLAGGQLLLVNRGWVPYEMNTVPVTAAAPPAGTVQLSGILHPAEQQPAGFGAGLVPRDPPEGALQAAYYVDLSRLAGQMPGLLQDWYLQLDGQAPAQAGDLPIPAPEPELTEGPHLGYVLQWFSFALIGIIGYVFLMRRVISEPAPDTQRQPKENQPKGNQPAA